MQAFANFILRGRLQALLIAAVAAALMLVLPLFSHVAGGALALVTLRNGVREGALIALGATLVLAALASFSAFGAGVVNVLITAVVLLLWLPVLLGAGALRLTRSLDLALLAVAALAGAAMLVFHAAVGDAPAWWRSALQETLIPVLQQLQVPFAEDDRERMIEAMSRMMSGALAAAFFITAMINLFIGRWLQALVFNPGGFGGEFRALKFGRRVAIAALAMALAASLLDGWLGNMAVNLLFLFGAMYALQGLAVVHAMVALLNAHRAWLIALYVLMLFALPQVALALAAAGFADSWLDLRGRAAKPGAGKGEE